MRTPGATATGRPFDEVRIDERGGLVASGRAARADRRGMFSVRVGSSSTS